MSEYVARALEEIGDSRLPLSSVELRAYAVMAANWYGLDVGLARVEESGEWREAYNAALAALEVRNRLNGEFG